LSAAIRAEDSGRAELEREYRELRLSSRTNRGLINIDAQSTLSDGLLLVTDSIDDTVTETQRYQDYIYDGGIEVMDRYLSDFDNLRPSISNMQRPAYKEWYRNNIYNRWCRCRCRGTGFAPDIDLADLIGMWMSYRPSPWSTDTSSAHSSVIDSSFEWNTLLWHPEQPHLIATMTPPTGNANRNIPNIGKNVPDTMCGLGDIRNNSKNKKKRGNSESVGSKLKKSKNTWKDIEESTEGLENLSWK
jgi:hypothetical protein